MDGDSDDEHQTEMTKRWPKAREAAPRAAIEHRRRHAVLGAGGHKT